MYHNPKNIVDRYLKKLNIAEKSKQDSTLLMIQKTINNNLNRIMKKEEALNYEKLEHSYISEYLKKKKKFPFTIKSKQDLMNKSASEASLISFPVSKEKKALESTDRMDISTQVDAFNFFNERSSMTPISDRESIQTRNASLPLLKNDNSKKKFLNSTIHEENFVESVRINRLRKKSEIIQRENYSREKYQEKIRKAINGRNIEKTNRYQAKLLPKDKRQIMNDYYRSRVKQHFMPSYSTNKSVERSLKAFMKEKPKSFKDFKIVKLFG